MQTNEELQEIVKIWKDNNIERAEFEFSCGGDSMNETEIYLYDNEGNTIDNSELVDYFDNEVYHEVDFYEASDGHYMGESGVVVITLDEDGDEPTFVYDKNATAEFEESVTQSFSFVLTDDEKKIVEEKISNLNGGEWGGNNVNYKVDCIVTDEEDEILEDLMDRIESDANDYDFEDVEGEQLEDCSWSTSDDGDEIEIEGNKIKIHVTRRFLQTQPSLD